MKTLHIMCWDSASGSLKVALKNAHRNSDEVLSFFDDLSIGPLFSDNSVTGLQAREHYINWDNGEYTQGMMSFFDYSFESIEKIVIWHTDNASDKLMLYLVCSWLLAKKFTDSIVENYLSNAQYCCGDEDLFVIGMLSPEQMQASLDKTTPLIMPQIQLHAELWQQWKNSDSMLRIFKDNTVIAVTQNFYDDLLLSYCSNEFQKCAQVGYGLCYAKFAVGDGFLFDRIRFLVESDILESDNDDMLAMRHFSVRLTQQ